MSFDDEDVEVAVSYDDVVNFVEAAESLVRRLESEISNGTQFSTEVVLALNEYKVKAEAVQNVLDFVESSKVTLN